MVDTVTLGFVDDLVGPEVKGAEQRSGTLARDGSADVAISVGASDRTNATITLRIENLQADSS